MRRRRTGWAIAGLAIAGLAVGVGVQTVRADDDRSGTYTMRGRVGYWNFFSSRNKVQSTLWLSRQADGTYEVLRTSEYRDEGRPAIPAMRGIGRMAGESLEVEFTLTDGLSSRLRGLGADASEDSVALFGSYTFDRDSIEGYTELPDGEGGSSWVYESGSLSEDQPMPGDDVVADGSDENGSDSSDADGNGSEGNGSEGNGSDDVGQPVSDEDETGEDETGGDSVADLDLSDDVYFESPNEGDVYLAGQQVPVVTFPEDASVRVISGEASYADGLLTITGTGPVMLTAESGDRTNAVSVRGIECWVTGVSVLQTQPLLDAQAPHFSRDGESTRWEPAAILRNEPLQLEVTLTAAENLTGPAIVDLTASGAPVELTGRVVIDEGIQGSTTVTLTSAEPLSAGVDVHAMELEWKLNERTIGEPSTLRVYTLWAPAVDNPLPRYSNNPPGRRLNTKLHTELACTWAQGATENDGDGLAYKLDNAFRHHVHWQDYGDNVPEVPHYPEGADAPLNYDHLPGRVYNGKRSVSGLYYPDLEPTEDWQEYEHYRSNFGWWVLDNPRYTGGRCNQQASLICDVFGTVGVEARVYYIERVGMGAQTGRPMRRFYRSSRSDRSWNFHGVVEATMQDGSTWIYDGSGSWPPRRINGAPEDLFGVPDGTFVAFWHEWHYQDRAFGMRDPVPANDVPTNYVGQDGELTAGTWRGVPLQEGE